MKQHKVIDIIECDVWAYLFSQFSRILEFVKLPPPFTSKFMRCQYLVLIAVMAEIPTSDKYDPAKQITICSPF